MPFLISQGSFKPGRGFSAAGTVPGPPTFPNVAEASTEGNQQLGIIFSAPTFNGRIRYYWL